MFLNAFIFFSLALYFTRILSKKKKKYYLEKLPMKFLFSKHLSLKFVFFFLKFKIDNCIKKLKFEISLNLIELYL